MGDKRVATRDGIAFVAQRTYPGCDVWHGYPEAWVKIDEAIRIDWLRQKRIKRRDIDRWWSVMDIKSLAKNEAKDER